MSTVGIIANPASGKDIRRLVAYGITFDNLEKVNIVRRSLLGLAATDVKRVIYMPDYYGIVPKAVDGLSVLHQLPLEIEMLDMEMTRQQEDSQQAAQLMKEMEADCILTLGGDGTNRMVAKGCGRIPIMPVSTGTNNVFPEMVEGTIAGLAAGVVAGGIVDDVPGVYNSKRLVVYKDGVAVDHALVDAVILNDIFIGSRAVWDVSRIRQVLVTRADPGNIGISAIAGNIQPIDVDEPRGMVIDIGNGDIDVIATLAPGLIEPVHGCSYRMLEINEEINLGKGPGIIALDGEREVEIGEDEKVTIKLTFDGPRVVNARAALRAAVARGYSRGPRALKNLKWLKEAD